VLVKTDRMLKIVQFSLKNTGIVAFHGDRDEQQHLVKPLCNLRALQLSTFKFMYSLYDIFALVETYLVSSAFSKILGVS
jgi:hypothetical protein